MWAWRPIYFDLEFGARYDLCNRKTTSKGNHYENWRVDLGVFEEAGGEIEEDPVDLEEDLGVFEGRSGYDFVNSGFGM